MFSITSEKLTTKEIILNVASELFMDRGYLSTSTRMIAVAAGITQPNLYHYFKTKEEIYIAVLDQLSIVVNEELLQIVTSNQDTLDNKLREILSYLKEKHPVNFNIMQHDMNNEISKESHQVLFQIWRNSYLEPLIYLFDQYETSQSEFSSEELARHFYSTIAPYIHKERRQFKELTSDQIIHLFVYGILDKNA